MEVQSLYKYARISAFKARDVAREIQGLPVSTALDILTFTPKKAAYLIGKTLKSAVANAENNHDLAADQMVIKEATIGEGPTFKRFKPRARGSAGPIRKRTAHIRIILSDEIPLPEPKVKGKSKAKGKAKAKASTKKATAIEEPEVEAEEVDTEIVEGASAEKKAPAAKKAPAKKKAAAKKAAAEKSDKKSTEAEAEDTDK